MTFIKGTVLLWIVVSAPILGEQLEIDFSAFHAVENGLDPKINSRPINFGTWILRFPLDLSFNNYSNLTFLPFLDLGVRKL